MVHIGRHQYTLRSCRFSMESIVTLAVIIAHVRHANEYSIICSLLGIAVYDQRRHAIDLIMGSQIYARTIQCG